MKKNYKTPDVHSISMRSRSVLLVNSLHDTTATFDESLSREADFELDGEY